MQEDKGKVQEDQRNLGWGQLSLFLHQLAPEVSQKLQKYRVLSLKLLYKEIDSLSFLQTHRYTQD